MNKKQSPHSDIYGGYSGEYDIIGESSAKEIPYVFPFGFCSKPKKDKELIFLKNAQDLCLGTVFKEDMDIKKGEVKIYNDFGAFIKLLSDGSVNINGLIINKDGNVVTSIVRNGGHT